LPEELAEYVLAEFPMDQAAAVDAVVVLAADATECFVREGAAVAMNRFNGRRA
jgi:peptidyl-tRNA hydrolase